MISWCWLFLLSTAITQLLLRFLACFSILVPPSAFISDPISPNFLLYSSLIVGAPTSAQVKQTNPTDVSAGSVDASIPSADWFARQRRLLLRILIRDRPVCIFQ